MAIYLIRHAHAGSRTDWRRDDRQRPLSEKGRRQAERLVDALDGLPIGEVWSSPARRCTETVEPLATSRALTVAIARVLDEGADPRATVPFLLERAPADPAVATHGDVIPKVIRLLVATGMRTDHDNVSQKGSVWIIETDGDRAVTATYLPPPPLPEL